MPIPDLSANLVGLYDRVASRLNLDRSFVEAVALGEQESAQVEAALENDLKELALRHRLHLCPPIGKRNSA